MELFLDLSPCALLPLVPVVMWVLELVVVLVSATNWDRVQ